MNTTANLGKAPVRTLVLQLAIPSMTAQFVNVLYSIIDRMYIGHISENGALALAGAGICGPIVTLLTSFGTLVGIGGSITMGIRMGEKNHKKAEQVLANSFLMLSIFSVLLTVSLLLLKDKLLMLFGASGATFPFANTYLTIYTTGTFFALMATGLNYFINCQGFPLVGMFTVLIGAGCNILSDPIFIFGFHMGISGAAIATVISQILSCIFAMTFLLGKKVPVKITFGQYNLKVIRKILSLGFSPFLILATDSLILIFMNTVLQKYGGASQGDMLITCATIAQSYLLLITSPMIGISGGTQAILSYNYGARNAERVKRTFRLLLTTSLCYSMAVWLLIMLFPQMFAMIFSSNAELIAYTKWALRIYCAAMGIFGAQIACQMTFISIGNAGASIIVAIMRKFVLLLPLIYLLPHLVKNQTMGVYLAEPAADVIAVSFTLVLFFFQFKKAIAVIEKPQ